MSRKRKDHRAYGRLVLVKGQDTKLLLELFDLGTWNLSGWKVLQKPVCVAFEQLPDLSVEAFCPWEPSHVCWNLMSEAWSLFNRILALGRCVIACLILAKPTKKQQCTHTHLQEKSSTLMPMANGSGLKLPGEEFRIPATMSRRPTTCFLDQGPGVLFWVVGVYTLWLWDCPECQWRWQVWPA